MSAGVIAGKRRGFRAPGTTFMITGGVAGGIGALLFHIYGGRSLGEEAFAPIGLLWTLFFTLATVLLVPMEQYVTREVASGRRAMPRDLIPTLTVAGIGSLLGGAFVVLTLDRFFESEPQYIAQIVLLMLGYSLLFLGKGVLAGNRRFTQVGWVLIVESAVRLAVGLVALAVFASATSLGWAMVAGGFAVLAMGWWRHDAGDVQAPSSPARGFLTGYVGGTSSAQVLLAGAPLAVAALGGSPALISVVFVTFTLYRAPLTLILALQGRVLPYLVDLAREAAHTRLVRIAKLAVLSGAGLVVLGGLVGWLVGPDVIILFWDEGFAPSSTVAMLAAAGVVAAAAAQITSQVLVAEGKTRRLSSAWFGGLLVGVLVLLIAGGEPDTRAAVAFAAGELTALGLMAVLAIRR